MESQVVLAYCTSRDKTGWKEQGPTLYLKSRNLIIFIAGLLMIKVNMVALLAGPTLVPSRPTMLFVQLSRNLNIGPRKGIELQYTRGSPTMHLFICELCKLHIDIDILFSINMLLLCDHHNELNSIFFILKFHILKGF